MMLNCYAHQCHVLTVLQLLPYPPLVINVLYQ